MSPNELSELAPLAASLNQESDAINPLIASLNEALGRFNLGIEVWLEPSDSDPELCIGFAKIGEGELKQFTDEEGIWLDYASHKWQLATRRKMKATGSFDVKPLLKASRNVRIEGLRDAPRLIDQLKWEAKQRISAIQDAKKLISELSGVKS